MTSRWVASSDVHLLPAGAVMRLLLQAQLLGGRAHVAAWRDFWEQEGEPEGRRCSRAPPPVAVGDNQLPVLRRQRPFGPPWFLGVVAGGVAARLAAVGVVAVRRRMAAGGGGCSGDQAAAAFHVRRLAVRVAVLLVDVQAQFPPLPRLQHFRLHLAVGWWGEGRG